MLRIFSENMLQFEVQSHTHVSAVTPVAATAVAEETEQAQGKTPAVVAQGAEIGAAVVLIELAAGLDAEQCLAILKIAVWRAVYAPGCLRLCPHAGG